MTVIQRMAGCRLVPFVLTSVMALTAGCGQAHNDLPKLPDDSSSESVGTPGNDPQVPDLGSDTDGPPISESAEAKVLAKYQHLDPQRKIDTKLLKSAVLYFNAKLSKFANKKVIAVIDIRKRSSEKRMNIVDMKTGSVWSLTVAHGKGSDANHNGYATSFSNVPGSNATSLGFYKGAETYSGAHGLSLRLDGLSSTNSNARARAIVIHGASYVHNEKVIQGRSWGCPAVDMAQRDKVISLLKGGSLIYVGDATK